jgi:hypothetical protein
MREGAKRVRNGGRIAATKGAVEAMTHVLAKELGPRGVTVNARFSIKSQRGVSGRPSQPLAPCWAAARRSRGTGNRALAFVPVEARAARVARSGEVVMQKQVTILVQTLVVAALLFPAVALAQSGAGHSSGTAGGVTGSQTTTGLASDQARISPPGTNSLGTANSSGATAGIAGAEQKDSRRIDAEIQAEDSRIDAKINSICRGC